MNAVPLISIVHDNHFVVLVLVSVQLREHVVALDLLGREVYCFFDVPLAESIGGAQVKQDQFDIVCWRWSQFRRELPFAHDLDKRVVDWQLSLFRAAKELFKTLPSQSAEVFALEPFDSVVRLQLLF